MKKKLFVVGMWLILLTNPLTESIPTQPLLEALCVPIATTAAYRSAAKTV